MRNTSDSRSIKWTFNTSHANRILITFHSFHLWAGYDFLDIGDDLDIKDSTRIARFSGNTRPSDVITIGSAAWIRLRYSRTVQEKKPEFNMTISNISKPGIGYWYIVLFNCSLLLGVIGDFKFESLSFFKHKSL